MNKKIVTAAICVIAVVSAAVVWLTVSRNQADPCLAQTASAYSARPSTAPFTDALTTDTEPSESERQSASSAPAETTLAASLGSSQETSQADATALTSLLSTVRETLTSVTATVKSSLGTPSDISSAFVMPRAPKYISKFPGIDFDSINLASYKYNAQGNYYYTDDKNCWQDNFGYNQVYDSLAVMGHMYYDTVRVYFDYDNKHWLIQLWKGQYGYVFVGSEIGIYTRSLNSKTNSFACAAKEDWLYMEMTCLWDSAVNGNYEPVFNRPYDKYWWCTGFVLGWLNNQRKCTELEVVGRITFKDTAMANAFSTALQGKGFTRLGSYDFETKDSFTQIGRDVVFVWLNLDE